jgi:hypothetical protein
MIYDWTTYIVSRCTHRKHIYCPAVDICKPHRTHHFLYCCIYSVLHKKGICPIIAFLFVVAYFCRLYLSAGCLPRICLLGNMFTESLLSSRSTCHNMHIPVSVKSKNVSNYHMSLTAKIKAAVFVPVSILLVSQFIVHVSFWFLIL